MGSSEPLFSYFFTLKVIAVIHGGAYILGSSSDPLNAASLSAIGDVVLVSMNYRLGIFGFADMKELAPGNLGLYDQRLALQWIQEHIAEFGGDPGQVTVVGVSAGSMSLSAQIITPIDSKNLFQSAVLDAGVVAGFYEDSESSFTRVKKIATKIGCPIASNEILDCLRRAPAEELLPLSVNTTGDNGPEYFIATTDGKFVPQNVEDFVEKNSAKLRNIRMIIGYAKDEGTLFVDSSLLRQDFPFPQEKDEILEFMKKISFSYNHPIDFGNKSIRNSIIDLYIDENPGNSYRAVAELQSDALFKCPINNFIQSYSRHNDRIYAYQFDRLMHATYFGQLNPDILGAYHGSPYMHFSGALFLGSDPIESEDRLYFVDTMKMIVGFARSKEAPKFRGMLWPSFSRTGDFLVFNDTSSIRKGLSRQRTCSEIFTSFDHKLTKISVTDL